MKKLVASLLIISLGLLAPVLAQVMLGIDYKFFIPLTFILMMFGLYNFAKG